jgi:hypothetical protein
MAAPIVIPSVPWMPERAWTTCVSNGAISGLTRSNYVPFAPQPLPPGMSEAEYNALDPEAGGPGFGVPPPDDCFPRYVMWREAVRNPDHMGGQPGIQWQRQPGWDFRNDCVSPDCFMDWTLGEGPTPPSFSEGDCNVGDCTWYGNEFSLDGAGPFTWEWRIWNDAQSVLTPQIIETTENVVKTPAEMDIIFPSAGSMCNSGWQVTATDSLGCIAVATVTWQYCCV